MPFLFAGELAAIATSICFSFGPTFFTLAGQKVGSVIVNRTRLVIAVILLSSIHLFIYGTLIPLNAGTDRWMWFTLSGVIGLTLGDAALFQAFVMIGARRSILIFATNPIIGAVLAWLYLGEELTNSQIIAMVITLSGVAWVVAEKNSDSKQIKTPRDYLIGVFLALLGAAGQAIGLITAKFGLVGNFSALSGTLMRMIAAMITIWLWTFFTGKTKETIRRLKEQPIAFKHIFIASFIGPVLGVWLSLIAVQYTEVGIASTLISLNPLFMIPVGYYYFQEKISPRSILGTFIALIGVALLFLY